MKTMLNFTPAFVCVIVFAVYYHTPENRMERKEARLKESYDETRKELREADKRVKTLTLKLERVRREIERN